MSFQLEVLYPESNSQERISIENAIAILAEHKYFATLREFNERVGFNALAGLTEVGQIQTTLAAGQAVQSLLIAMEAESIAIYEDKLSQQESN